MPASVIRIRSSIQRQLFTFLYHHGSFIYDKLTDWLFLGEWARWQDTALAYLPTDGTILELGCGTGRLARRATDSGWHWLALDQSQAMIAKTRRQFLSGRTSIIQADARHLPLAAQSFDGIAAAFPAAFIFTPEAVRELARVLRPGGTVVVVLSAELLGEDWPHQWRRGLLAMFYGQSNTPALPATVPPYFRQTVIEHETASGRAQLLLLCLKPDGLVDPSR